MDNTVQRQGGNLPAGPLAGPHPPAQPNAAGPSRGSVRAQSSTTRNVPPQQPGPDNQRSVDQARARGQLTSHARLMKRLKKEAAAREAANHRLAAADRNTGPQRRGDGAPLQAPQNAPRRPGSTTPQRAALATPGAAAASAAGTAAAGVPVPELVFEEHGLTTPHLNMHYRLQLQHVADTSNCVVMIRDPNFRGQTLMVEGHATKSSHIKAKSSETGPTAGFVAEEPRYTKLSQAEGKQAAAVKASLGEGCRLQQIFLSPARVAELTDVAVLAKPDMSITHDNLVIDTSENTSGRITGGHLICSAVYPHRGEVLFELAYNAREDAFAVYELGPPKAQLRERKPVMGLTNPLPPKATPTRFDAVCADYDLFAIHATEAESTDDAMRRYVDVPPRSFQPFTPAEREARDAREAANRPISEKQDHNLLNTSPIIVKAIDEINAAVKAVGGPHAVCHHSDEIGNPNSDNPGFPQFAFYPDTDAANAAFAQAFPRSEPGRAVEIKDWAGLARFNDCSRAAGYTPPPNNLRWGEDRLVGGKVPGLDVELLVAKTSAEIVGNTAPGSFERFQMVRKAVQEIQVNIGENAIVKKPKIMELSDIERSGREAYLSYVKPALDGMPASAARNEFDESGRLLIDDARLALLMRNVPADKRDDVGAFIKKVRQGDELATQLQTISATMLAVLGAVAGLVRDAPADKPFAKEIGTVFRDTLDNSVALLMEKTDKMVDVWEDPTVCPMRNAKFTVTETADVHATLRSSVRSIEDDVTAMVNDGYVLTTEKHAEARANKAFRSAVLGNLKESARARRDTAQANVNKAWNAANSLAYRSNGGYGNMPKTAAENSKILRVNELRGASSPGASIRLSPGEQAARNLEADVLEVSLRETWMTELEEGLDALGMAIPDGLLNVDGGPADDKKMSKFLEELGQLRGLVLNRQRPTKSLDIL
ncbi:MAG: anthrax toxin-like adenylyl cyclase domain-containing protein, partial [Paracoccaceae bacterium]